MPSITKRTVDTLKPDGTDRFVWDDDLKGLGVRVRPSGALFYVVQWKRDGRTRRVNLGAHGPVKPEEARNRAKAMLGDVAKGLDPAAERDARKADITVAELCGVYLAEGTDKLKASSNEAVGRAMACHIEPLLGRRKLASLTLGDIERLQHDIAAGKTAIDVKSAKARGRRIVRGGKGAAARAVAYFRMVLAFAVRQGLRKDNPAAGVKLHKTDHRERFLSPAGLARLGEALAAAERDGEHPRFVAAIRLLLLTGARKQEILRLQWHEVDLDAGCLRLVDSKTGRKVIVLGAPAREILAGLSRANGQEFVLPAIRGAGPLVGLQSAWERIRARAGLDDMRVHDLRHGFASVAVGSRPSTWWKFPGGVRWPLVRLLGVEVGAVRCRAV